MISRRKLLGYGVVLGGTMAHSCVFGSNPILQASSGQGLWTYHPVDPIIAEKLAYENNLKGGCCFGVFSSILMPLADVYQDPYRGFPLKMMEFGNRGVGGYGSICGAANGGAAVIGLFVDGKARGELITQLLKWYEQTEIPSYRPEKPLIADAVIPSSTAYSVLCATSISKWCQKSGLKPESTERRERCARLTADVARKTAELLNTIVKA